jgi:LysM repeat protein
VGRFGLVNRRAAARIAAPVAFLVGVTLAVVLVRAGLSDEPGTTTQVQATTTTRPTTAAATTRRTTTRAQPVFATVESGDTLDQIALDHETTVERLLELNPNLDPRELQVGQQVRVR